MKKEFNRNFPVWTSIYQAVFDAIKALEMDHNCLTTIDYKSSSNNKVFIICNVSKKKTGAVLSFGKTWESACPVTFDSQQLTAMDTHKNELLAIVHALHK